MAENEYQEEGATEIDFVMRNYEYANMAADMGQCRFGFATDLKAVCAKGDSGATVYKFLKDASGSSNTASTRLLFADANGAASSHASLTFDGTTLKIAGALRKAGESIDNLTLGAAGLVTLGGNLALGTNFINRDGTAGVGIGIGSTGQRVNIYADSYVPDGSEQRYNFSLFDTTNFTEGSINGSGISFRGKYQTAGTYSIYAAIKGEKANGTANDNSGRLLLSTRLSGQAPATALILDENQNGYIKSKLMVGSLTETPENQLSVFKDANESVFLSVGNSKTGQNGVRIGFDDGSGRNAVYDISYGTFTHMFRYETSFGTGVYAPLMSLYYDSRPGYNNIARVYGDLQVDGQMNVDGDAQIDGNLTTNFIKAKLYDGEHHMLYIISGSDNIALFEEHDESRSLIVFGDLNVADSLEIGGLTASQIVETDANKKLISVAKGTAYNANFGTGSNNVCQGNDSRLSDARVPINNDYYVQGSSSTRTTDAADTDVNSYSQSGFYRTTKAAPHIPTEGVGYGIIHTNSPASNPGAFQLASRWVSNNLFYRVKCDGTWEPWVELYHSGTTKIDVNDIQCETFRLNQTPTSGTITPDKYIIIKCNGTNYKIPVKAV